MTNAASLVVGKAGGWVTDSLVVSLVPGDLFAYTLLGQGSQCDISYQTYLLGWSKPISLSNLPSAKEGWSKHYLFFPLQVHPLGVFSHYFSSPARICSRVAPKLSGEHWILMPPWFCSQPGA